MPSNYPFFRRLASHPNWILGVLTVLLPFIPALIAYFMKSTAGATGISSSDAPILSTWTYLQVAVIAYFVFLSASGPPNYLTAYTAIIVALGLFMQRLGEPIGLGLARLFAGLGIHDPLAPATASYMHHLGVGVVTWFMARLIIVKTKKWAQPTTTFKVGESSNLAEENDAGGRDVAEVSPHHSPDQR